MSNDDGDDQINLRRDAGGSLSCGFAVGRPGEAGQEGGREFGEKCQTTTTKTKKAFVVRRLCCMSSEGRSDTSWVRVYGREARGNGTGVG
jgi:hypothetical protein